MFCFLMFIVFSNLISNFFNEFTHFVLLINFFCVIVSYIEFVIIFIVVALMNYLIVNI